MPAVGAPGGVKRGGREIERRLHRSISPRDARSSTPYRHGLPCTSTNLHSSGRWGPHNVCFFSDERPELIQFDPMGAEVLEGGSGQEICVLTSQLVVPGDRGQMVTGHPADAAHRDLLLR